MQHIILHTCIYTLLLNPIFYYISVLILSKNTHTVKKKISYQASFYHSIICAILVHISLYLKLTLAGTYTIPCLLLAIPHIPISYAKTNAATAD